jgi:hypothetical protein
MAKRSFTSSTSASPALAKAAKVKRPITDRAGITADELRKLADMTPEQLLQYRMFGLQLFRR